MKLNLLSLVIGIALAGCSTMRAYEGQLDPHEIAIVAGDYRFNAGSPLSLILRAVDGKTVDAQHHAVELAPGDHVFLVDCQLRESKTTTRHEVSGTVAPGGRYGFTAELSPGMRGCAAVQLQSKN